MSHRAFSLGQWLVFPSRLEILRHDGSVCRRVSHKVMAVLDLLARHPGEVLSRDDLIAEAWDGEPTSDESVATVIYELRKALDDNARDPCFIETIRKRGYRLLTAPEELPAGWEPASVEGQSNRIPAGQGVLPAAALLTPRFRAGWIAVAGCLLAVAGWFVASLRQGIGEVSPESIRTLALVPVSSPGDDQATELLAEGLTARLLADLSRFLDDEILTETVLHPAVSGAWRLAGETGADAVIEGSVWRSGERLWISAQLVDTRNGRLLWGGSWERLVEDEDVFQRELALEIAAQVRRRLGEKQSEARIAALEPEVAQAMQRGTYFLRRDLEEDNQRAESFFHRAVELAPEVADAHAGLAETYAHRAESSSPPLQAAAYGQARDAAHSALELEADSPAAHLSLASVYFHHDWEWDRAESHFLSAWMAAPRSSSTNRGLGTYLSAMGRHHEAISRMREAVALDPGDQAARLDLARTYYMARRFDEASEHLAAALDLAPDSLQSARLESRVRLASGELEAAIAACRRVLELSRRPQEEVAALLEALDTSGLEGALRCLVEESAVGPFGATFDPVFLAAVEARRGNGSSALEILGRAYETRHGDLVWIQVEPMLDPLRSTEEFHRLVSQLAMDPVG